MSKAAAIFATFSDFKTVKSRSVAQLVFEVPIEHADAALATLGGVPLPGKEQGVGIALVKPEAERKPAKADREPKDWRSLSMAQQAGILASDAEFTAYLRARLIQGRPMLGHDEDAAVAIRRYCGVASRSDLDRNEDAAERWVSLVADFRDRQRFGEAA